MINRKLMKFESKKLVKSSWIVMIASFVTQFSFLIFFALIGQLDSSSSDEILKNVVGVGAISSTITLSIISIYAAVLMNHSIVENYTGEARVRLYSFPSGRGILFKSKVVAFINRVIFPELIGLFLANAFFWVGTLVGIFKSDGSVLNSALLLLLLTVVTTLITLSIVLLSVILGIRFSSTQITLVSVIIMIAILGNLIAHSLSSTLILSSFVAVVLVLFSLIITWRWSAKIEEEEVL